LQLPYLNEIKLKVAGLTIGWYTS